MDEKSTYGPLDWDSAMDAEQPGEFPMTRGVYRNMYRGRLWTMRQYAGFATAEKSNRRYRYLLEKGQTGLSIAFDLPTQMGIDADHPLAHGEVGKVGVSIGCVDDMEILLESLPLHRVSISMTINSTAAILLAMVLATARRRGVPWSSLRGTVQNDLLKEYIARGTYIYPPRASMRLATDIIAFCTSEVPKWSPISISGYHIREAGSTAVQEVAFTLANGIAYVEHALRRGLAIDEFGAKLSFFFNAHNDFLEEIAKYRAARRLWARIMKERFSAQDDKSCLLRFHTQTAGSTLTAQQPENNIVRVTVQALAAVLGGTQSLHTNSLDEALALPSERSATVALRTQQILAHESGVAQTVDPLGGAYAIESITSKIEEAAMTYIALIDEKGGMENAIEEGYVQKEIQESAYRYQKSVQSGDEVVVGMNRYRKDETSAIDTLVVDPAIGAHQRKKLAAVREDRDPGRVRHSLTALKVAARGTENLVPPILDAVEARATVGEISDLLREVFGQHEESVVL